MANLFHKQAKQYSENRPSYPLELFQFIASKTPTHDIVWDVGTGSGQAARSLAEIYKNVVATDTSQKQLDFALKLPNVRYQCTPPQISISDLERDVAPRSTVDLVTVAQAVHWFHLPSFYDNVRFVLKKPHGVVAAWCYTLPGLNVEEFDSVFQRFYDVDTNPYWEPERKLVDGAYRGLEFPFEPLEGEEHTGPFEFAAEVAMEFGGFLNYVRSWSAYQIAREKGVELLREEVVERLRRAWMKDGNEKRMVKYTVYLRIGRVGSSNALSG
ncbi:uncharacterized protein LOC131144737 [Malania oleifera]|uniref:uncharacterized protein LOC131144737 n=1 Tax=Malania oleifera TaxID=397392 RepID=UPI0025AE2DAD|nr:uncharacterized protein LOC131144737 [Malania oleifera]